MYVCKTRLLKALRKGLALTALLVTMSSAIAQSPSQYEIDAESAEGYATAYLQQNLETMAPYLAEDATFEDPSNRFTGRADILDGLAGIFGRITRGGTENREISKFRSGNRFLYSAFVDFYMMVPDNSRAPKEMRFQLYFSIALKVEDGQVVEHIDYVDTEAFVRQLQAQR